MQTIRRWLRTFLIRLPGGFGETVLLPKVRHLYDQVPFLDWRTKRYARSEARRLLNAISAGVEEFTLVYDTKVTGLAYGTVVNFVAIVRFLNTKDVITNLYFVDSDPIACDDIYTQSEIDHFIESSIIYAEATLRKDRTNVSRIRSDILVTNIDQWNDGYLLFNDFTRNRRPFFRDCFNVFNYLMASADPDIQHRSLYSSDEFRTVLPKPLWSKSYVSWACRYSKKADFGRQTSKDEFLTIYRYLRRRFPDHEIIIVSDTIGCRHYSTLSKNLDITDLSFSKDYTNSFIEDAALVMNSELFFSFRAGGIGQVPLLSRVPFEIMGPLMNEIVWNKRKLTSWQTKYQTFVVLRKHQFEGDREFDLTKLGFQELVNRDGVG